MNLWGNRTWCFVSLIEHVFGTESIHWLSRPIDDQCACTGKSTCKNYLGNFWPWTMETISLSQPFLFTLTICHCELLACRLRIRIQDLQWLVKRNPWIIYFSCYIRNWLVQRLFLFEKIIFITHYIIDQWPILKKYTKKTKNCLFH